MLEPIAIIGRGCVLPGALSPQALREAVVQGLDLTSSPPPETLGIDFNLLEQTRSPVLHELARQRERVRGGFVTGFESVFDPVKIGVAPSALAGLDPVFSWALHAVHTAFVEAGLNAHESASTDLILGNLSYPNPAYARFAQQVWMRSNPRGVPGPNEAANRFFSGYLPHFIAGSFGFAGRAFSLDAACASSLYAIKLACDRLRTGAVKLAIAGGIQHADNLFLQAGFNTLQALSPTGKSRPFHKDADGLLPAEGAAVVLLRRLSDAVRDGNQILGLIRTVGLSNDGRQRGFLAPDSDGQIRAMRAAYASSEIDPSAIDWVECHATGTTVGDAVEVRSLASVFAGKKDLPVGSLKSNLGHLLATSGCAALLKVIAALESDVIPRTLHSSTLNPAFEGTFLRPVQVEEPWFRDGIRRAAINGFGFGGTNAHLIFEEWKPAADSKPVPGFNCPPIPGDLAICGITILSPEHSSTEAWLQDCINETRSPNKPSNATETPGLPIASLRFPPLDLKRSLAQQTVMLETAVGCVRKIQNLQPARTGVLIGMECDPGAARHGLRWRLASLLEARDGRSALPRESRDWEPILAGIEQPLSPAAVIGTMPNIVANRLNAHFDWGGFGFTISSGELSGLVAIDVAAQALATGELDAVLVGAVDLCREPVHASAANQLLPPQSHKAGDAAVALVLKRLEDAVRDGDSIQAVLRKPGSKPEDAPSRTGSPITDPGTSSWSLRLEDSPVTREWGHAHAASGLMHVAAAALCCEQHARFLPDGSRLVPWLQSAALEPYPVEITSFTGRTERLELAPGPASTGRITPDRAPAMHWFAGRTMDELIRQVESGTNGGEGRFRMALVLPRNCDESPAGALQPALQFLQQGARGPAPAGVYFRTSPVEGGLAFVFTGAASAHGGMGRDLFLSMPSLGHRVAQKFPVLARVARQHFTADPARSMAPLEQLQSCALICQSHALLSREFFRLVPSAILGLSSGETNGLFAMDVWKDMDAMFEEIEESGMYGTALTGRFQAAEISWKTGAPVSWKNWRLIAPLDQVRAAVDAEPRVHITIIQGENDCVIGGETSACNRVLAQFDAHRAIDLGHDMIVHCPELAPFAETWRRIHHRQSSAPQGVRFYAHAWGRSYDPDASSIADALVTQALHPIDLRQTVEAAWNDGVRIFLEHGPRNVLSGSIQQILAGREAVVLSWDKPGIHPQDQIAHTAASLFVTGIDINLELFSPQPSAPAETSGPGLSFPFHNSPVLVPDLPFTHTAAKQPHQNGHAKELEIMLPAPALPPVQDIPPIAVHEWSPPSKGPESIPSQAPSAFASATHVPVPGNPLTRVLAEVSQIHRGYLDQQTRLYHEFLEIQKQLWNRAQTTPETSPTRQHASKPPTLPNPPVQQPTPTVPVPAFRSFDRQELEILASGRISSIFGPAFAGQDGFRRQVRMPMPPLLLVDRVTRIEGEPGSMQLGRIDTETDVAPDAWYLHHGRLSPGVLIESGQADLLLISWLGVDALNQDRRVYRLLGCKLTFHEGGLPRPGETLRFQIHVDGHARTGDVRLFFFHYDCRIEDRLMLSVRDGQAGFFTDEELASSGGVLWDAATDAPCSNARIDSPPLCSTKNAFSREDVAAFVSGDAARCFGPGFEPASCHTRTPTTPAGRLAMLDSVPVFEPQGGPWGRGYLKAEYLVKSDAWFYNGHFLNDPCMPGTLMADAALQALGFYFAALGFTISRDGWRFEPVTGETFEFRCRGQVIPDRDHLLTYEVFIEEIRDGAVPEIFGALLCSSDGFKVFHCRRFGLRLVPDWPLNAKKHLLLDNIVPRVVSPSGNVRGDFAALLACAWGTPSDAFGEMYRRFDSHRRVPRLPGPPYHFMSRVIEVTCEPAQPKVGATVIAEYDVSEREWYFESNGHPVMPFAVLLEVALQPCGWLASYMGFVLHSEEDLCFRNLDGAEALLKQEILPGSAPIRVHSTLTRHSRVGSLTIVFFKVDCTRNGKPVLSFNTSFGFFDKAALAGQKGLPTTAAQREILILESDVSINLEAPNALQSQGRPRIASAPLRMIDHITGWWPGAGSAGLGRVRGWQRIRPDAWYFKAHFFQDPVQPGSLGIEALLQLLQCQMLLAGLDHPIPNGRFEPIATDVAFIWKYRGQVLPLNREVVTELEITRVEADTNQVLAVARGSLWVDGMRIYEVENLAMRIVPGAVDSNKENAAASPVILSRETTPWLLDHCPTCTAPALPMMAAIHYLSMAAAGSSGQRVTRLENVNMLRWVILENQTLRLRPQTTGIAPNTMEARLFLEEPSGDKSQLVAMARITTSPAWPTPPPILPSLESAATQPDPYQSGSLFHGPAFQNLISWKLSTQGSTAILDPALAHKNGNKASQELNPVLLDCLLHGIPHDHPEVFFGPSVAGLVAYPRTMENLSIHGPTPAIGPLRVEARPIQLKDDGRTITIHVQAIAGNSVWIDLTLTEVLFPKGPLGNINGQDRTDFLKNRKWIQDVGLSRFTEDSALLTGSEVQASNWFPGSLQRIYSISSTDMPLPAEIAVRDLAARIFKSHPSKIQLAGNRALAPSQPLNPLPFQWVKHGDEFQASASGPALLDPTSIASTWRLLIQASDSPVEHIYFALLRKFLNRVHVVNPDSMAAVQGRACLFLGNHQVAIESLLFGIVAGGLQKHPILTIAKGEHRSTWLGKLISLAGRCPGVVAPRTMAFFDREDKSSMLALLQDLREATRDNRASIMVHAEGTRSLHCRKPVARLSGVFLDLAIQGNYPIIPVRFAGGLPIVADPDASRLEFAPGFASQDVYFGSPILPENLAGMGLVERRETVLRSINELGPDLQTEEPNPPDIHFEERVRALTTQIRISPAVAAVIVTLEMDPRLPDSLRSICKAVEGHETKGATPWISELIHWARSTQD